MDNLFIFLLVIIVFIFLGVKIVPQQQAWIVERFGKYHQTLVAGINFIFPLVDRVAYKHSLKERPFDVHEQTAITQDNVSLLIDGVIYFKINNPIEASYGIENPQYALVQLAQTSMRSAIGKIHMDKTFEERETLNAQIVNAINEASVNWGIQCMRYEIKDIKPPATVLKAMEMQVAAERQKRAEILESEGKRQSKINIAEASKQELVLNSEGSMEEQVNKAKGEAEAIIKLAEATSIGIGKVAHALEINNGDKAAALKIAEQYINAFSQLAKEGNSIIIPANTSDASSMVAQAMTIFNGIANNPKKHIPH